MRYLVLRLRGGMQPNMDARRARIAEAQLVSRGFSQEQARSAVRQGPEAIAALTAGGPLMNEMSTSTSALTSTSAFNVNVSVIVDVNVTVNVNFNVNVNVNVCVHIVHGNNVDVSADGRRPRF